MLVWGLNSSIDFKGGSLLEVSYSNGRPSQSTVIAAIAPLNLSASVIPSETNEYDIRTVTLSDAQKNSLISVLSASGAVLYFNYANQNWFYDCHGDHQFSRHASHRL